MNRCAALIALWIGLVCHEATAIVQVRSPLEQIISCNEGRSEFVEIRLVNDGEEDCTVEISADDFSILPDGEIQLSAGEGPPEQLCSCVSWIQIPTGKIFLKGRETKTLQLPIVVPEDVLNRSGWAMIYVQPTSTETPSSESQHVLHTLFRYGIQVIVDIGQRPSELPLKIGSPERSKEHIKWVVHNPSPWMWKPQVECMIVDSSGVDYSTSMVSGKILPYRDRIYTASIPEFLGECTAVLLLDDGKGNVLGVRDLVESLTKNSDKTIDES